MKKLFYIAIYFLAILTGFFIGQKITNKNYTDRCMKYFGNQGYPANFYCKLFVGEIKARDE